MLRESGLDLDNEFSTFALRKINEFRNALDAIIVKAVVSDSNDRWAFLLSFFFIENTPHTPSIRFYGAL